MSDALQGAISGWTSAFTDILNGLAPALEKMKGELLAAFISAAEKASNEVAAVVGDLASQNPYLDLPRISRRFLSCSPENSGLAPPLADTIKSAWNKLEFTPDERAILFRNSLKAVLDGGDPTPELKSAVKEKFEAAKAEIDTRIGQLAADTESSARLYLQALSDEFDTVITNGVPLPPAVEEDIRWLLRVRDVVVGLRSAIEAKTSKKHTRSSWSR